MADPGISSWLYGGRFPEGPAIVRQRTPILFICTLNPIRANAWTRLALYSSLCILLLVYRSQPMQTEDGASTGRG